MAKRYKCGWANCPETMLSGVDYKVTATESSKGAVTDKGEFCCLEHAWRWLRQKDEHLNGERPNY